MLKFKLPLQQL